MPECNIKTDSNTTSSRTPGELKVSAIISVYDDSYYLDRCLRSMAEQQISAIVIDNDATPETRAILSRFHGPLIESIHHLPRQGYFDWESILRIKQKLAKESEADWIMFWDTDEIREPPAPYPTLRDALHAADRAGYNAVNFSEFVFLPMTREESWIGRDYVAGMRHYYFFEPRPHHRLNAWKRADARDLDILSHAGHRIKFTGLRVFPEDFVLRHYLFLSWQHAVEKYCTRSYAEKDISRGWSKERSRLTPDNLRLPTPDFVHEYRGDRVWVRSDPKKQHPCFPYKDA